ncbi:MAG: coproporphyrinogen dehydrogenase HemZ, partial [Peptostreptococcus porci]|nr:coproporphyrinogen dehydrogenase HemZ [Peptostreptococcus porci]
MIDILLIGHDYRYELSEFLKLFSSEFSFLESSEVFDVNNEDEFDSLAISKKIYELSDLDNDILINRLHIDRDMHHISIISETIVISNNAISYQKELSEHIDFEKKFANSEKKIDNVIKSASKRLIQKSMFEFLKNRFDAYVPWGILTGIRPLKIVHSLLDEGLSEANVIDILKNNYLISDEKIDLLMKVAKRERKYIYPVDEDKISLYVSIPFCPTKCLYCSFPSHPLAKFGKLRDLYLEKLIHEAKGLGELIKLQGK